MNVHCFHATVPAAWAQALAAFEQGFTYPLGPGRTFRISHGDDYARFFRAIGDASVFVAERDGRVLGCLAVALRQLVMPSGEERRVAYLADLKIAPEARSGFVLRRLMMAAGDRLGGINAAVAVVMEGTRVTPEEYTGRVGIPKFTTLGRVAVLRLPTASGRREPPEEGSAHSRCPPSGGPRPSLATFRRLNLGRYATIAGRPEERSELVPTWLLAPDGSACGLLEDTRRAKRLLADDGSEIISAHLSSFAAATVEDGTCLLRHALALAHSHNFPALFVSVPESDAAALLAALHLPDVVVAPAVVYGVGLPPGDWNLNTAEI